MKHSTKKTYLFLHRWKKWDNSQKHDKRHGCKWSVCEITSIVLKVNADVGSLGATASCYAGMTIPLLHRLLTTGLLGCKISCVGALGAALGVGFTRITGLHLTIAFRGVLDNTNKKAGLEYFANKPHRAAVYCFEFIAQAVVTATLDRWGRLQCVR